MTNWNDHTLLLYWYRHRSAEAFKELASRHARMVYATALRVLRNAQDAEDILQESFLALARTRRPPTRNVAAWLHQRAYHAALNLIRARNRRSARDQEFVRTQSTSTKSEWDDIRDLVDEAVAGLPTSFRDPVVRYFFQQESHAAIAAALGVSRQTVTYRVGRGVALVRQRLSEKGVVVPAVAALVALVHENTAGALPTAAATEIGRIALAASPSPWAAAATCASGMGLKVAAALLVVGVGTAAVVGTQADEHAAPAPPVVVAQVDPAIAAPAEPSAPTPAALVVASASKDSPSEAAPTGSEVTPADKDPSRSASVSGRVILPDGRPFAGAKLELMGMVKIGAIESLEKSSAPPVFGLAPSPQSGVFGMSFDATTDEEGQFSISELFAGEYRVRITGPDGQGGEPDPKSSHFYLEAGEQKTGLEMVFGGEGTLRVSGVVTDSAGVPVPNVRVTCMRPVLRNTVSDEKGRFVLSALPEGTVVVSALASAPFAFQSEPAVVRAGETDVRVVLLRGASIEGRVIDAKTRQPIPSFKVTRLIGGWGSFDRSLADRNPTIDNPEGHFQFETQPGEVAIVAQATGYALAHIELNVEEGNHIDDLELALERSEGRITGLVVDDRGAPIPGAAIYLGDVPAGTMRATSSPATTSSADGAFTLEVPPVDVEFIGAYYPGYAPGGSVPGDPTRIVLKQAAKLYVEVRSAGEPVQNVRVYAYPAGIPGQRINTTAARANTGPDGRATVEEVAPGPVDLQLRFPSRRSRFLSLDIATGEEKSLSVDFPPAVAAVEGTVTANGVPVSGGVRLHVETEAGPETYDQSITSDGTFRISDVAAGPAWLSVNVEEGGQAYVDDVPLVPGEVTVLDVDATMTVAVRGTISGLQPGEAYSVLVYRGALNADDLADYRLTFDAMSGSANLSGIGGVGAYVIPLHQPGTYTIVLESYPTGRYWQKMYREISVMEIPESGEVVADFGSPQ